MAGPPPTDPRGPNFMVPVHNYSPVGPIHGRTALQDLQGHSDEECGSGPSDDEADDEASLHGASRAPSQFTLNTSILCPDKVRILQTKQCTLTNNDCSRSVTANFDFQKTNEKSDLWSETWHNVVAFVSTEVPVATHESTWVIKIVYCPHMHKPNIKKVKGVFEHACWDDCYRMRESFQTWVLRKGFDLLIEEIEDDQDDTWE